MLNQTVEIIVVALLHFPQPQDLTPVQAYCIWVYNSAGHLELLHSNFTFTDHSSSISLQTVFDSEK